MPSQERIDALVERLGADEGFAAALESDAEGTLREVGFDDLAATVEQERDRIGELLDRIYRDEEFRRAIEKDPTGELGTWGIPEEAIAPVLVLAGAPEDVVDRATADVEAHIVARKQATMAAVAAMLGTLAFAQTATAGNQPAGASAQVAPASLVQVSPDAQAQVTPSATAQVTPAAKPQVSAQVSAQVSEQVAQAQARWQGVQPAKFKAQGRISSALRTLGLGQ
jgi:hypothetical protein